MKQSINKISVDKIVLEQSREIYQQHKTELEHYIDLLFEWNGKINLVSRSVSRETIREHIVHSLLPIPLNLLENHAFWLDSGTGGGLPGIPLAICRRDLNWILNDNVRKKMRAVEDIIERKKLTNCSILPKSISLAELKKGTGIATKHAFKIPDLLRLLGKKSWLTILIWKGADDAEREIRESKKKFKATLYEFNFGRVEPFYEGKGLVLIER